MDAAEKAFNFNFKILEITTENMYLQVNFT